MNTERQDRRQWMVCVDDSYMKKPQPVKGEIYEYDGEKIGLPGFIHLKEFTHHYNDGRVGYRSTCFRPVQSDFGEITCEFVEQTSLKIAELEEAEKEMA